MYLPLRLYYNDFPLCMK